MPLPFETAITVDVEQDCPPVLASCRGVEEGLPRLVELFSSEKLEATFFVTGVVAERYPDLVRSIIERGHEIGCHGHTHKRFSLMTEAEARGEIQTATAILRRAYPVICFRAPNLDFPEHFLPLLEKEGYRLDSSQAKYKHFSRNRTQTPLFRIPASTTSSVIRLPRVLRNTILGTLKSPAVLFVHPWEFVDLTTAPIRLDCRFNTGDVALRRLGETVRYFKRRGAHFVRLGDLAPQAPLPPSPARARRS